MKIRINFKTDTIKESLDNLLPLFEGYNFDLNEIVWNHFDDLVENFLENQIKANDCSFDGDPGEYSVICEVSDDFENFKEFIDKVLKLSRKEYKAILSSIIKNKNARDADRLKAIEMYTGMYNGEQIEGITFINDLVKKDKKED